MTSNQTASQNTTAKKNTGASKTTVYSMTVPGAHCASHNLVGCAAEGRIASTDQAAQTAPSDTYPTSPPFP